LTAIDRTAWLALLTFALVGIGCGQQDESHTNTGPETNANSNTPTPATAPEPTAPGTGTKNETNTTPGPAPAQPKPDTQEGPTTATEQVVPRSTAVDEGAVELENLTYDDFLKRVAANPSKAKYTMVDAWATWCGPCKENFPHVVQMHQKFGNKGLAVVSLSFDDPAETKQLEEARTFLREKKAQFPNYLLDEEFGVGFEKFGVNSIPAVFIYGPDGKEVRRFTWDDPNNQFTYD